LPLLDGQVHHDTHSIPMGNYVIGVGNYVIVSPSELGNYMIADTVPRRGHCLRRSVNAAALFASAAPAAPLYSLTWHMTSACYYVRT